MKKSEEKTAEELLTINEFLSVHSRKRNLDDVFRKWFYRIDQTNPKKTVQEWQKLLSDFYA